MIAARERVISDLRERIASVEGVSARKAGCLPSACRKSMRSCQEVALPTAPCMNLPAAGRVRWMVQRQHFLRRGSQTDRAAYSRLTRLITLGKSRGGKNNCILHWDDVIAYAEGMIGIWCRICRMTPLGSSCARWPSCWAITPMCRSVFVVAKTISCGCMRFPILRPGSR